MSVLDDLRALTTQLNRQAFARPPIDGWLNSFLAMLYERFSSLNLQGLQVVQVIGNVALQMGSAGNVPGSASEQYALDTSSPISATIRSRQMTVAPDSHLYPITVGDDVIAVLIAYIKGDNATLDQALETVALQLGPAIAQAQHVSPPRQHTGRLTRQFDMMRSLVEATRSFSSLESSDALSHAVKTIAETFKVEHVSIYVDDLEREVSTVVAEYPSFGYMGNRMPLGNLPLKDRLETDLAPIIIDEIEKTDLLGTYKQAMIELGIRGVVVLPMITENELIGSIHLDSYETSRRFGHEELEAGMTIASQLAINVRNSRLYNELQRRATQLERIADLSRRVTSTFDRYEIFRFVKEETERLVETNLSFVGIRDSDKATVLVYVLDVEKPAPVEIPLEQAAMSSVLNKLEPIVIDDISGSELQDYKILAQMGMHAAVLVPLVVGGGARGVYGVLHKQKGHYAALDVAVVEQIGNQLVIALENARLYTQASQRAEVEELMNRLSSGIQGRGDMQTVLLSSVQQMAEALNAKRARVRLQMSPIQTDDKVAITDRIISKLRQKGDK